MTIQLSTEPSLSQVSAIELCLIWHCLFRWLFGLSFFIKLTCVTIEQYSGFYDKRGVRASNV